MQLRIFLTLLAFGALYATSLSNVWIRNNILLILPALLLFVDWIDSLPSSLNILHEIGRNGIWNNIHEIDYRIKKETRTLVYQSSDKILDLASYILASLLFPLPPLTVPFIILRTIGVGLFLCTKNREWLVFGADFVKEYIAYSYLFKGNNEYLGLAFLAKMAFEAFFHLWYYPGPLA